MLQITIPPTEVYDSEKNEFVEIKEQILQLEHSLVSLSKWESRWKRPFLTKLDKSHDESVDYIRCMTINQSVDPNVYNGITNNLMQQIISYIDDPMTATTFANNEKRERDIITAEIIYYWMISFNIPFECQKWHLNRLLTLINVCNIKNQPAKKMSPKEALARQRELNALRKRELNTTG